DNDGLIMSAGPLQIIRKHASGDVESTQLGQLSTTESTNRFGELDGYASAFNGAALYSNQVTVRDAAGRIVDRTESVQGNAHAFHYVYDDAGRLTDVSMDGALQAHYVYDDNGNRRSLTQASATLTGTYDAQDRLSSYGPYEYTYSAVGALKTKTSTGTGAVTTYDYDSLGNLRGVQLPDGRNIQYAVDARSRRIAKSVNGTRSYGLLYAGELKPVAQLAADDSVIATFVYATRSSAPDYMRKGGNVYRFLVDHVGSVRLVVNVADGSVAQRIDYDEFGSVLFDTNPGFQPFGFAGGLYDPDTGLVRFGARDYEAVTGRWTAKDPILFGGGQANLYAYVGGDPVNRIDPSGEVAVVDDVAVVGAAMAATALATWCVGGGCQAVSDSLAQLGDAIGQAWDRVFSDNAAEKRQLKELGRILGKSVDELSDSLHKIKKAAGLRGKSVDIAPDGTVTDPVSGEDIGNICDG
ncbi:MAG TPA: RHS repeat-associated core domain-containing protein, partial [Polyangiales bacterium]|nr:RHS repeat-associated core domain-containing protein [Polyangiales bacterium]